MRRREFLATSAAALAAGSLPACADHHAKGEGRFRLALKWEMISGGKSIGEKFDLAKAAGYSGVEPRWDSIGDDGAEFKRESERTGIAVHGVVNAADTNVERSVRLATEVGATSVLIVAGRVNEKMRYDTNYEQWQERIIAAVPAAKAAGVLLLVENVWNNFLFSPLEMARFVDEINQKTDGDQVGVYFDVGNIVRLGYPNQWIEILGDRIKKLDIKEYSRKKQKEEGLWNGFEVELGEGDVDFPSVVKACEHIGYRGWATAEVRGGNSDRIAMVHQLMVDALEDIASAG